mmetsp:Transcript_24637/g.77234  ORF Transcript_24637/g.77234 Transcript_24637/m.77234 type:complete len:230 (+) Transcript_24637:771-1460(+)
MASSYSRTRTRCACSSSRARSSVDVDTDFGVKWRSTSTLTFVRPSVLLRGVMAGGGSFFQDSRSTSSATSFFSMSPMTTSSSPFVAAAVTSIAPVIFSGGTTSTCLHCEPFLGATLRPRMVFSSVLRRRASASVFGGSRDSGAMTSSATVCRMSRDVSLSTWSKDIPGCPLWYPPCASTLRRRACAYVASSPRRLSSGRRRGAARFSLRFSWDSCSLRCRKMPSSVKPL